MNNNIFQNEALLKFYHGGNVMKDNNSDIGVGYWRTGDYDSHYQSNNDDNETDGDTYECVVCEERTVVNDFEKRIDLWCTECDAIKTHERVDE